MISTDISTVGCEVIASISRVVASAHKVSILVLTAGRIPWIFDKPSPNFGTLADILLGFV